jgi:hypothetical protein
MYEYASHLVESPLQPGAYEYASHIKIESSRVCTIENFIYKKNTEALHSSWVQLER